jgi:hypothetical protein
MYVECAPDNCVLARLGVCRNVRFKHRRYKRLRVAKVPHKGRGLFAAERIEAGVRPPVRPTIRGACVCACSHSTRAATVACA